MTDSAPLYTAMGCLTIIVIVCLMLLASPNHKNKNTQLAIEVAQQEHQRTVAEMDRRQSEAINRLQEQINSLEFVHRKRTEATDDDIKTLRREIDDLRARLKARTP
ncbi:hypothetical protein NoPa_00032 [Pseudomonas phage vB_PpuM-NoPa]|uniref:Holin n=4 Tax=Tartuvirus TaxID=3424912 RepID=A0AAX4MYJ8_9CAUD